MKKILFILLAFVGEGSMLLAQSNPPTVERQVLAHAGGYFKGNGFSISWTAGEPVTETLKSGNLIILTQGFQQPDALVTAVEEVSPEFFGLKIYPNPAEMAVTIEVTGVETLPLQLALFDVNGRLLTQQVLSDQVTGINVSTLPSGLYFMRLISPATRKSATVKFQKIR